MSKYTATVIDTTGIQPYIFGSNRLRENIGGSYLVAKATDEWVKWALHQRFEEKVYIPDRTQPEKQIDQDNLDAELVYTGGGNAVILFKDRDCAVKFTRTLSEKVLKEAPGLKIVVAHSQPFEWGNSLWNVIDSLMKELERKKREYNLSVPLLGLGVTASCLSTGLVAVDTSDHYSVLTSYPVS
ncbi:MAG: Cas10/Cmr2 second palm domain-containing protein, partial [Microcoleus sp.]